MSATDVQISLRDTRVPGELDFPPSSKGLVLFAHGSGSSRFSPRNQAVARVLREAGVGTLLFDLLTKDEERSEMKTGHLRFNISFLAERLVDAARWALDSVSSRDLSLGFFGSSTGAAAALVAAAALGESISAVVSRGGRPDLAGDALERVTCPTLLIVGGKDEQVIPLNEEAYLRLPCEKALRIVPGATHLFQEPGTLEKVSEMAAEWFVERLVPMAQRPST
jgi:pimeloyl-ACP methyl ester carboxylesterase